MDDRSINDDTKVSVDFKYRGESMHSEAEGNGPIDALKTAIRQCVPDVDFSVEDYSEHSLSQGSHAKAAAYIKMKNVITNQVTYGVGVSSNITRAGIRGIFSAMNRLFS